jgi:peptidoglycan/LPS O-acetylase OafA/YrhL
VKAMPSRSGKLAGFDGLRALAACSVLTYHVAHWPQFAPAGALAPIFWELKGGVAVFFVISGALLYLPYARAICGRSALPDWRGYAHRRMLRILPAYWVALTVVAVGPFGAGVIGPNLWSYYGLSQIYQPQLVLSGLGGAWSLCVEMSFYALLPLLAWVVSRLANRGSRRAAVRLQLTVIAAAGCASLALRGVLAGSLTAPIAHAGTTTMVTLPGLLDWFAIGMALAVLRAEIEARHATGGAIAALGRRPGVCLLLALAVFLAAVPFQHGDMFLPWYGLATHLALGLGSGLLLLPVIVARSSAGDGRVLGLLRHPRIVWMGTISYGIYLWHIPVLELIGPHLSKDPSSAPVELVLLMWFVVLAGGVALGAASWYLVERPLQRLLGPRRKAIHTPVPAGQGLEIDAAVQSWADPLNPQGVAADHLA